MNGIPARAERVALVRNPSWDPSTDDLRKAYVDRITLFGPPPLFFRPDAGPPEYLRAFEAAARQVDRGRFDMFFDIEPPPDQVDRYRSRVTLSNRVDEVSRGSVVYLSINLALPPFDDLHVRKAVNAVIDRERLAALWNAAGYGGEATSHIAPDVTEGGLLAGWPGASSPAGDLAVARAEMRLAPRYDTDGDGLCDVAACRSVPALFSRFSALAGTVPGEMPWPPMAAAVGQELRRIGIELDLQGVGLSRLFFAPGDPESHTAIVINLWWAMDYPNASTFFAVQFPGDCIGQDQPCFNPSLVGATSGQLRRWGYGVRHVPNVDDRIRACLPLVGDAQLECWARLDQYLMEEVVPRVPYLSQTNRRVWSDRIARFAWNSYTTLPALDQIALTREAIAGSSPS